MQTNAITEHGDGILVTVVDVAATQLAVVGHDELRKVVDERVTQVTHDAPLATKTALHHADLGNHRTTQAGANLTARLRFSDAISRAYGWGAHDTVLQCPLTSDVSVTVARLWRATGAIRGYETATWRRWLTISSPARHTVDPPTAVCAVVADGDAY